MEMPMGRPWLHRTWPGSGTRLESQARGNRHGNSPSSIRWSRSSTSLEWENGHWWRLNVFNTLNLLIPTGPQIVAQTPVGGVSSSTNQATVTFRDPMNTSSFSLADIVSFTGPNNADLSASITGFTWLDSTHLQISFAAQTTPGLYALTLAPSILDSQGRSLDQDGDRSNGEPIEDRYVLTFAIDSPITYVSNPVAASVLDLSAGDAGVITLLDNVDDASMVLDLGAHSFTFYGKTYDQLSVSSNGLISLGGANDAFLNHDLNVHSEAGIIAALWDDWQTDGTAQDASLPNSMALD